jgi:type II secretory pathway predicted ATPase ExeA
MTMGENTLYSDIFEFFDLKKEFSEAGYFECEQFDKLVRDIKPALHRGGLLALVGIVGVGKTTTLRRLQQILRDEKEIIVSRSFSVDKARVNLNTLMTALFYDLATQKDFKMPSQSERRERVLHDLIGKSKKPIALFIDEAHDLHKSTLLGLKRLVELAVEGGGKISIVLAGHPKLKNDLRSPVMEETGARAKVFDIQGMVGYEKKFIYWMLEECAQSKIKPHDIFSEDAIDLLAERLISPLQIIFYAWRALEEAFLVGERPITADIINEVLAPNLNDLEPKLARYGYSSRILSEQLLAKPNDIKSLLRGTHASEARTKEFQEQLKKLGIG